MRERSDADATQLIFGDELVNTSDATVKRVRFEKAARDRACANSKARHDAFVASCDAVFAYRVGEILRDVEVQLPQLPDSFLEGTEPS